MEKEKRPAPMRGGFSALQRAENSSMARCKARRWCWQKCFSALQRAENSSIGFVSSRHIVVVSFSALQRAENSSIVGSRARGFVVEKGFSALQRAENSSIRVYASEITNCDRVSVLFSEPKIPQSTQ